MSTPRTGARNAPPVFEHGRSLMGGYEVLFSDVWGVLHDGVTAYSEATDALERFRARGGTVILVSNAPVPNTRVAEMLADKKVPRGAWDAIVSSGDIALSHIDACGFERLHWIGPVERDKALFDNMHWPSETLESADAILCSGLDDDRGETAESYRSRLQIALDRKLPFVCANPDLVVDVGGQHFLCAGAIADLYEEMGGPVFWAGKPHAIAYRAAHETAERIRGKHIDTREILVIGDAVRTDLEGAKNFGVDALFIASGIHAPDLMDGREIDEAKLTELFKGADPDSPVGAMSYLRW
ncbi:MAG: TIGR01459 family HAD-type hydrolase [Hyphomicrobiaceae bacterium]